MELLQYLINTIAFVKKSIIYHLRKLSLIVTAVLFVVSCGSSDDPTFSISITAVPTEAGTVTPAQGEFEADRTLEISATPNQHWVFNRWEGDYEGTDNPASIVLDSDKDIAAIFVKRDYPLTIEVIGEGTVTEEVVQPKTTEYPHGTVVRLEAIPESGWEFEGWQGDVDETENPMIITIEDETEIIAHFTRILHPVLIEIVGEGRVVDEFNEQIKDTLIAEGTELELTAEPEVNWIFSNWTGDIESTDNPLSLTVDGPISLTAEFLRTFRFNPISNPEEGGTITPGADDFVIFTSFDVEAIPNDGWRFVNWEGDFTGTQNPFNITMNGNKTVTANFERLAYTVDTDQIIGQGSVEVNLISGTQTADGYLFESVIELIATPNIGWSFVRWEGDVESEDNPLMLTVDDDLVITAVFSFFDGGIGTVDEPFEVSTLEQINEIRNYTDAHFTLMNNIDASSTSGWNGGLGFEPIGTSTDPFTGSFDGNGFIISNLTMSRPDEWNVGMFGYIDDGEVQNLSLLNVNISGDQRVGAFAGHNEGLISNVSVSGSVSGDSQIGGIAGRNYGTIEDSESSTDVSGTGVETGGITGINVNLILRSHSTGIISGGLGRTGGLIGTNNGTVEQSSATGDVSNGNMIGGLVGLNRDNGVIRESFAIGNVTGDEYVGGFAGRNHDGTPLIENSYSLGSVTGDTGVGGFVGANSGGGEIRESYSSGSVNGLEDTGGFGGRNSGDISDSYWDRENSGYDEGIGLGDDSGITGLDTAEMTGTGAEGNMPAFDWVNIWKTSNQYPELQWE